MLTTNERAALRYAQSEAARKAQTDSQRKTQIEARRKVVGKWLRALARRTNVKDARALVRRVAKVNGLSNIHYLDMPKVILAARRRIAAIDREQAKRNRSERAIKARVNRAVLPLARKLIKDSAEVTRSTNQIDAKTRAAAACAVADAERARQATDDEAAALRRRHERFEAKSYRQLQEEQARAQRDLDSAYAEVSAWAREAQAGRMRPIVVVKEQNARNEVAGEHYFTERFAAEERHHERVVANAIKLFGRDEEWLTEHKREAALRRKRHDEETARRQSERNRWSVK